jgi:hypothetical protein
VRSASRKYLLVDHGKFGRSALHFLMGLTAFDAVLTGNEVSEGNAAALGDAGVKLVTGKQAVAGTSEALEAFGGAGYIDDSHLPQLLRDSQVLPIWEGTTNVLSLDGLRAPVSAPGFRDYRSREHVFEKAADLETHLRERSIRDGNGPVYLTRFGIPLREAIDTEQELLPLANDGSCDSGWCFT